MDFYKQLPAPVRILTPVICVLLVLAVIYMTTMRKPAPVLVVKTQDYGVYTAALGALNSQGIKYLPTADATKSNFEITVMKADQTRASLALAGSGIKDLTGTIQKVTCPAPPGFTATKAANERADNCADEMAVQNMLITAGASAANVKVSQKDNDTLIGPETSKSVLGQVFLDPQMQDGWNAEDAARAIATAIGTSIDNVTLTDGKLQTLFDGSHASSSGGSTATTGDPVGSGEGCSDMATATEIATKEADVSSCYSDRISADLTKLLGGSDRYQLTVNALVDPKTRTSQFTRNANGTMTSSSSDKSDGTSSNDVTREPSVTTGGVVKPAGDISKLSLAVTLDSNFVDDRQELAVKRLLSTYIDPARKDPAPQVTRIAFAKGAGGAKVNTDGELADLKAKAHSTPVVQPNTNTQTVTKMPKGLILMIGVVIAALLLAMLVMWRKSSAAAAERARYEAEFANQQRVLDTYAQQDPAGIAADLEKMFGMPTAQEPAF